jgi:hypothetical protein
MHFFRARTGMTMREWRSRHLAPTPKIRPT